MHFHLECAAFYGDPWTLALPGSCFLALVYRFAGTRWLFARHRQKAIRKRKADNVHTYGLH
jgi:hypothetical protein